MHKTSISGAMGQMYSKHIGHTLNLKHSPRWKNVNSANLVSLTQFIILLLLFYDIFSIIYIRSLILFADHQEFFTSNDDMITKTKKKMHCELIKYVIKMPSLCGIFPVFQSKS